MSKTGKSKTVVRAILVAVYSIVIAFVLIEILLRIADPIGIRYYFDVGHYLGDLMEDSDDYSYIHRAGFSERLQGVDVTINSEGLRSPEFPVDKPEGERRILFLGDSVVFGWGVAQDSIFPALVQDRLRRELPEWTVISAGVGSWNTRNEYEWLRLRGIEYDPDVIVLVIVPNDVEPKLSGRTRVDKDILKKVLEHNLPQGALGWVRLKTVRAATRVSYTAATARHILRARSGVSPLEGMYDADSPAWADARDALDGIVTLCREHDVDLVVYLWGDGSTPLSRKFLDAFAGALGAHGYAAHAFPPRLFDPRYRNSRVDSHANATGHALMADAFLETLLPLVESR